jgi:hypothetical protein
VFCLEFYATGGAVVAAMAIFLEQGFPLGHCQRGWHPTDTMAAALLVDCLAGSVGSLIGQLIGFHAFAIGRIVGLVILALPGLTLGGTASPLFDELILPDGSPTAF